MWNEGPSIIVAQWVFFGAACCAVGIRIGACRRPQYGFWWDDFIIFTALLLFLATCVTGTLACAWGVGKYVPDVDPATLVQSTLMGIIATDLGMLADAASKLGVALLVVRLFHPPIWVKWIMITCTLLNVVFNILLVIFSFVQCAPESFQWNRLTMQGKCWNIDVYTDFAYFTGAWTAFLDLLFSIYPLFIVSQLKMRWRKKLAVMATMSFGLVTCAVTAYKVATKYPLFYQGATDATRILGAIMFWNAIGVAFTIIAGSIPTWGWMFRTTSWKAFVHWISRGRAGSSRRSSATVEKVPFAAVAAAGGSARPTPLASSRPSRDGGPIVFPERAVVVDGIDDTADVGAGFMVGPTIQHANPPPNRRGSFSRSQHVPLDSIQQLEHSTWR